MNSFTERYADKIALVLSCFDRVVITGALVDVGYACHVEPNLIAKGTKRRPRTSLGDDTFLSKLSGFFEICLGGVAASFQDGAEGCFEAVDYGVAFVEGGGVVGGLL